MSIDILQAASVAGNVDSTFTVAAGTQQKVLTAHLIITTDATAVNRIVKLQVKDSSDNLILDVHPGVVVPASQSLQHFTFMQGVYRETSFTNSSVQVPIPMDLILPAGYKLVTTIENGVAADSYSVNIFVSNEHAGGSVG